MATIPVTTLTWGNTHSILLQQREKRAVATLKIVKPNGTQKIPIALPSHVTVADVITAWEKQGKKWDEIEESAIGKFFTARRAIWLPDGSIIWNVMHINDAPFDTCGYTELTQEKWGMTF